jgi:predicted GH43/DUF377 family glycosyl hydrolase
MKKFSSLVKRILCLLVVTVVFTQCQVNKKKAGENQVEKLSMSGCPSLTVEGWERHEHPAFEGFMHAYNPSVVEVPDSEYPFRMWFFGWITDIGNTDYAGMDAIYFARGKDLDHWEVYCKDGSWDANKNKEKWASVLYSSTNEVKDYYDTFHSGDPSVVFKDGIYYMAYSATSKAFTDPDSPEPIKPPDFSNKAIEGYPSRMIQCVMGATSTDGIRWEKTEKPLLIAVVDNKYPPDPCPDRIGDFHRPSLMWDETGNKWKLYFDYYNANVSGCNTGMAENIGDFKSGKFEFVHSLEKPLIVNWPNPSVVKIGSCYYCFADPGGYTGATAPAGKKVDQGWQSRQIRMAKSNDGITWEIMSYILPDSGIDACQVPQALVCKRGGKWWLYVFYATQVGWRKGDVKYPFFKEDDYNWFYDQIRYMRQEIKVQ